VARLRARHCLEFTEGARRVTKRARSAFFDTIAASGAAQTVGKYSKADDINKHFPSEVKRFAHTVGVVLSEEDKRTMRISKARKAGLSHGMLAPDREAILDAAAQMSSEEPDLTRAELVRRIERRRNVRTETVDDGKTVETVEYLENDEHNSLDRLLRLHGYGRRKGGSK